MLSSCFSFVYREVSSVLVKTPYLTSNFLPRRPFTLLGSEFI